MFSPFRPYVFLDKHIIIIYVSKTPLDIPYTNLNVKEIMSGYSTFSATADQLTSSSGNVSNATAIATLAGAAGKTTYIQGFVVTGSGSTVALPVTATVTGTVGGTMHFTYCASSGVLLGNSPLIVDLSGCPISASAQNTAISVSCPAMGLGNTNNAVVEYGFQI